MEDTVFLGIPSFCSSRFEISVFQAQVDLSLASSQKIPRSPAFRGKFRKLIKGKVCFSHQIPDQKIRKLRLYFPVI
jgi:hypothetical protein